MRLHIEWSAEDLVLTPLLADMPIPAPWAAPWVTAFDALTALGDWTMAGVGHAVDVYDLGDRRRALAVLLAMRRAEGEEVARD